MALVVSATGMVASHGNSLHPFFSASKNLAAPIIPNPPLLEKKDKSRSDAESEGQKPSVAKPRGRPKKRQLLLGIQKVEEPLLSTSSEIRTTVQNHGSRSCTDLHETSTSFAIDLNANRRKRRRTASPARTATPHKLECESSLGQHPQVANSGSVAPGVAVYHGPEILLEQQSSLQKTTGDVPSKKKVLKIGADGKLGSPSSRVNLRKSGENEADNQKQKPNERIINIKYGRDENSRQVIGRRISDILSSPIIKTSDLVKSLRQTPAVTRLPKVTHPFFLGKNVPSAEHSIISNDVLKAGINVSNSSAIHENGTILSKQPVPSSTKGAEAWARLSGFGEWSGSSGKTRMPKFPGATEPLWPPRGMLHIRGLLTNHSATARGVLLPSQTRKLKCNEVQIPENENILRPYKELTQTCQSDLQLGHRSHHDFSCLRKPQRRIMTGVELQEAVRQNVDSILPLTVEKPQFSESGNQESYVSPGFHATGKASAHQAILNKFESIAYSQTAFDRFECETHEWVHKHAPKCAATVLQKGREAVLLRDWLRNLTVTSIDSGNKDVSRTRESPIVSKQHSRKARKKRKKADELAEFILSSDEEAIEMEEVTETDELAFSQETEGGIRKSVIRSGEASGVSKSTVIPTKNANAVVISGPHGCGKSAAVYAVALELGFEIFEINPGTRRSGKDLLDKVGDMTRNHLVHQAPEQEDSAEKKDELSGSVEQEIISGHQSTMKDFLKPRAKGKTTNRSRNNQKTSSKQPDPPKKSRSQKQSLILLEEVDVLFEEDKQFWSTVSSLVLQSKRPVIMTCNDEARLPLDVLALHAIFRFSPPPEPVATDYLLLLAGNEGHLLSRAAVSTLYKAKHFDLRASIVELNFWCQMAIGDDKGGLNWLPIVSSSSTYYNEKGEKQRVVSEDSFVLGMGLLENGFSGAASTGSASDDINLLAAALNGYDVDVEDWQELINGSALAYATSSTIQGESLQTLRRTERFFDGISSGDILPCVDTRSDIGTLFDTTLPALSENAARNYTEGLQLLQADPIQDLTGTSTLIALSLKACSRKLLFTKQLEQCVIPLDATAINGLLLKRSNGSNSDQSFSSTSIVTAFGPLAESPKASTVYTKGPQFSIFDGPTSAIMLDAAPYVRSIVSYDLQLEEQRLRLSNLLSQGGRNGKRQRTTRASRAALEGGSKAHTRRERWFPNDLDFSLVLRTGGKGWQEAVRQGHDNALSENDYDRSRESSLATVSSEL